ncbi:MAG: lysophospholipid acyltransferase family protein [Elusimicrobia bacterium]|nr:lysophospholipid acyltransferase family protein [Candidatus Liberimonas magnetica]
MFKKIARQIYYLLALLFSKIILFFPYKIAVKFGGLLGLLAYYLIKDARDITFNNLRLCLSEKTGEEIKRISKEVFINQGKNLFELFLFPKITKEQLLELASIKNKDAMAQALSFKKGVFIASAHCGNWEIMGSSLAQSGFPINVIAKHIYIEGLNNMLVNFRKSKGMNVILRSDRSSAKEMLRGLRNNEAIAMLIDQDTEVNGVFVDFFSRPAWTPSGLAALALRTGASVVLALDVRMPDDRHECLLTGPLELIKTDNMEKDVLENTQMITKLIEDHIRKYPSQWVWMHKRWKTRFGK